MLQSQGNDDEAEALYRRTIEGRERVLGADHHHTLSSLANFAHMLESQVRVEEAREINKRVQRAEVQKKTRVQNPEPSSPLQAPDMTASLRKRLSAIRIISKWTSREK